MARAAGTTTPSVYQRFPAKQDLVAAIADQIRTELGRVIASSRSFEEAIERYLALAKEQREEYLLLASSGLGEIIREGGSRPGMEWGRKELARRHGGRPDDYRLTTLAMASLLHGAASFVLNMPAGPLADDMRESCRRAILALQAKPIDRANGRKRRR